MFLNVLDKYLVDDETGQNPPGFVCEHCKKPGTRCSWLSSDNDLCWQCTFTLMDGHITLAKNMSASNHARAKQYRVPVVGPVPWFDYAALIVESVCVYCGAAVQTADHVRPLCKLGNESLSNLVGACIPCNRDKAARLLIEWDKARVEHGIISSPKVAREYRRELLEAAIIPVLDSLVIKEIEEAR